MDNHTIITCALLLTLQDHSVLAGSIYRWSDKQGQVHFSDTAPTGTMTAILVVPEADTPGKINGSGLRPAERELLLQIQQRSQQQAQRAQARGLRNSRKRAEQQELCESSREKLHTSPGKGAYKQYSRYLRKHCW